MADDDDNDNDEDDDEATERRTLPVARSGIFDRFVLCCVVDSVCKTRLKVVCGRR